MSSRRIDAALEMLLQLDGEVFPMENGYWTKFEARRVAPSPQRPHGIRYSLTFHNKYNQRLLGYDNAHGIKRTRKGYRARRVAWDHKHKWDVAEEYEFSSAGQLLQDFWTDINRIIETGQV